MNYNYMEICKPWNDFGIRVQDNPEAVRLLSAVEETGERFLGTTGGRADDSFRGFGSTAQSKLINGVTPEGIQIRFELSDNPYFVRRLERLNGDTWVVVYDRYAKEVK